MKKIKDIFHMPTLSALILVYVFILVFIFCVPYRFDGFSRLHAYQAFANIGKILSFGLLDRTLVDFYMLGSTIESNAGPYNQIIIRSILHLTPVFLAWMFAASSLVNKIKKKKA